MNLKELERVVVSVLSDDLLRKPWVSMENKTPVTGHCYVACEAMHYCLGGKKSDWVPHFIRHEGMPHWFLKNLKTGEIIDPTVSQFKKTPPYEEGKGKGFMTKKPSKRAQIVIERMNKDGLQPLHWRSTR